MNDAEIQLLERYLDGTLTTPEQEQLESLLLRDADARARLRSMATIEFGLQDIASSATAEKALLGYEADISSESTQLALRIPVELQRSFFRYRVVLACSAAMIGVLFFALYAQRFGERNSRISASANEGKAIAKIVGMSGATQWTGDGGRVSSDLQVGTLLAGGTVEGTSPMSWVTLEFLDGSTFTVSGDSRLTFSDFGQKILYLNEGNVTSKVNPQQADRPMLVHTRTATLEVLGTEFSVEAVLGSTSLDVTEGLVRLQRLSDGRTVEVPANNRVVVGNQLDFEPQAIPPCVVRWSSNLGLRPRQVFGEWLPAMEALPARLGTIPFVHVKPSGEKLALQVAGMQVSGADGCVVLDSESRIKVVGISRTEQPIVVGLILRKAAGHLGGNYMTFTQTPAPAENGRFELIVEAQDLQVEPDLDENGEVTGSSPFGAIVETFYCSVLQYSDSLELIQIEFLGPGTSEVVGTNTE